jgi:fission process protein 1
MNIHPFPAFLQTSDVGEAFRPVVPPYIVTAAYGVSWLYLAGFVHFALSYVIYPDFVCSDVSYEAYKARRRGPSPLEAAHFSEPTRIGMVAVKRAAFQSIASMSVCSILFPLAPANLMTATPVFSGPCQHLPFIQQ